MVDLGFVFGKGHAVFFAKKIFKSDNSKDCITKKSSRTRTDYLKLWEKNMLRGSI